MNKYHQAWGCLQQESLKCHYFFPNIRYDLTSPWDCINSLIIKSHQQMKEIRFSFQFSFLLFDLEAEVNEQHFFWIKCLTCAYLQALFDQNFKFKKSHCGSIHVLCIWKCTCKYILMVIIKSHDIMGFLIHKWSAAMYKNDLKMNYFQFGI